MSRERDESTSLVRGPATALVREAGARVPDAYEQKFMAGAGTVLHRDRYRTPWPMHLIMGLALVSVVVPAIVTGQWIAAAIGVPALALLWMLFLVLRVTVSTGVVEIQYGLFGPTIAVAAIESSGVVDYDWKKFGGWGIRRARDGEWIYNMPGDGGRAVRIVWRDPKGRRRVTLIGTPNADALAQQIERARAALPAPTDPAAAVAGASARPALPSGE